MIFSGLLIFAGFGILLGFYIHGWLNRVIPGIGIRKNRQVLILSIVLTALSLVFFRNSGLLLIHFWIFAMLSEIPFLLLGILFRHPVSRKSRILVPLFFTCILLGLGILNMNTVVRTPYTYKTAKPVPADGYRIAVLTDTHYGTVQNTQILKKSIDVINAEHPDLVLLIGDIVEEGTSAGEMQDAFNTLGKLNSTFGTYYVYGNHDRQNYSRKRSYSPEELANAASRNGITVLQDTALTIDGHLRLVGREDLSMNETSERASAVQLLSGSDPNQLILLLDHQPSAWKENAAAGADIQISGHTHAGQIFPIGQLLELFGGLSYGEYHEGSCTIYVSSGFTGWGYYLRTSQRCEYVILDIIPN